ncbi:hypothetical protein PCASD_20550 [Puccinia coronata f. sp. avenae]|uniref:Uncharacterized protein n=1 Tax=Puccinia coronata f. sp. avenae TaxID=200324 RepID=A0A2N5U814_9BASI|nr:hypothetical protein PCASD_20550 [Puccinia coronata f. sp. avenae]
MWSHGSNGPAPHQGSKEAKRELVLSLHPKPSISVSHLHQLRTEQVTQQQQLHSTIIILPEL